MLGQINKFKVKRKTDLGYTLEKDGVEYFMHNNDCDNAQLENNSIIEAFLFKDKKNRVAATTQLPKITTTRFAMCEVNGVFPTGVFINIGISSKDLMLSKFDLPMNHEAWPQVNDKLPCKMIEKDGKLYAKLVTKSYFDMIEEKPTLQTGSVVNAYVYRLSPSGINLVDEDFNAFFVHASNLKKKYRLGEMVEIKVSKANENYYTCYLPHDKVEVISEDADIVWNYLVNHNGIMVFSSKSSPETIKRVFNMSKSQFKNALGKLYKEKKVLLFDDKTVINK